MTENDNINELADQLEQETGIDFIDSEGNERDVPIEQRRRRSVGELLRGLLQTLRPSHLKRIFSRENIRQFIQKNFTQSEDSNMRLASAVALGLAVGCLPYYFYQYVLTYFLARKFRLNKIIALFMSNISLPPFLPFILYASYRIGCVLMDSEVVVGMQGISYKSLGEVVMQYTIVGVVLALLVGAAAFLLSWGVLAMTRHKSRS
ncbi:MAG: DUF2062 domain-containing protein [Paludibacteraceae bacterium]|nr:DUF2062 domain-containing protein [Paludibacteraceae bacterium]